MQNDRIIVYLPGATTKVATLKQALTKAKDKAAKERTERERQEARVLGVSNLSLDVQNDRPEKNA